MTNQKKSRNFGFGVLPNPQTSSERDRFGKVHSNASTVFGITATICMRYFVMSRYVASSSVLNIKERSRAIIHQQKQAQRLKGFIAASFSQPSIGCFTAFILYKSVSCLFFISLFYRSTTCLPVPAVLLAGAKCNKLSGRTRL